MSHTLLFEDTARIVETKPEFEGEGGTLIDVSHSSLNYKDALALRGDRSIIKTSPLVPGIDAVGTVVESDRFNEGEVVVVNGAGLGESRPGGYTPRLRVPSDAAVAVPAVFSAWQAAAIGTAGFTAGLSVDALRAEVSPEDGPVLVTGATGGVGSLSVHLLASMGYTVHALTGRGEEYGDFLRSLGAAEIVDRADYATAEKPMQSAQWGGVIDTVGSATLANALAQTKWGGTVTACGMAHGADLPGSVLPFILRAVRLIGINSVDAPLQLRESAWESLAKHLNLVVLDNLSSTVSLDETPEAARALLAGEKHGRTVVEVTSPRG